MADHAREKLQQRIEYFFNKKIKPRNNNKPLVLGKIPNKHDLILSSNDYLCLSHHADILSAQKKVLSIKEREVLMSAIFLQGDSPQQVLQKKLANFLNFEASIISQSGWAANVGLLQTIADKDMIVYIDQFAHASLWDGIKFAGAKPVMFRHNSLPYLERALKRYGSGIVIVDSIYSSIGTMAPLTEIINLAVNYNCIIVVDESHSLGIYGTQGEGLVHELGLTNKVDFITASLAKTFAGRAGLIACSKKFANYFPYTSYPAIFSSALLHHEIAGLDATLSVIKTAHANRKQLFTNADYVRNGLKEKGYAIASNSQIISLMTGSDEQTEKIRDDLEDEGIFGAVFCYPAAQLNNAFIRFTLNCNLTKDQLDQLLFVVQSKVKIH